METMLRPGFKIGSSNLHSLFTPVCRVRAWCFPFSPAPPLRITKATRIFLLRACIVTATSMSKGRNEGAGQALPELWPCLLYE